MSKLVELQGKLEERRKALHEVFEQAGEDMDMSRVSSLEGDSKAKAEQVKAMNDELTELAREIEELSGLASIRDGVAELPAVQHPGHAAAGARGNGHVAKTIGELFAESEAIAGFKRGMKVGPSAHIDVDFMAAVFDTATGWAPPDVRGPKVVEAAVQAPRVIDLIPQTTTTQAAILYMEEQPYTVDAREVAEGSAKPEASLSLEERTSPVRKIAVWLPVTDEQVEDVPQVTGYLNNRLPSLVKRRLDGQILVGDGNAPNLEGITERTGVQDQPKGADPSPDAVYRAMQKIRSNAQEEPTGVVFHPDNWTPLRLLRTADGIYIWGSPSEPGPDRIWGLPVVQTSAMTEGTALVGAWDLAELAVRKGVDVQIRDTHDDFFVRNLQAVRAEMRAALQVYKPAAFCTVSDLTT